ncbi:MAG: hypothetical protein GC146_14760 [Limimaricola sp.]|uniref:hypothetical protein n=1 Tax=Limimaricola sp. TaxID=2211665 RepID=UPI001D4EC8DD|nr:hypothetical protein [Limimaricola sp.]MBI1418476.1 hypothetical protein [Limimaricola sp.]
MARAKRLRLGETETFPGGVETLIAQWQIRRARLNPAPGEELPPLDTDLLRLAATPLPPAPPPLPPRASVYTRKRHALMIELAGHSELALLHALTIAHLRKRRQPAHTAALFRRIWAEHEVHLLHSLPTRWLISAIVTFADHASTAPDRHLAQSFNVLFSLMKLYEAERQYSGLAPDQPFPADTLRDGPLPMGMPGFALLGGDLEANLLAPLWRAAEKAPEVGPLAQHLLDLLNRDPGTLFRRLSLMRAAKSTGS